MHVQRNQGSSNLGQIYDNEYAIQGQGSVSDSEISLTLIEDDTSFIDHEQSLNSLSQRFQLGLTTGSQNKGLHNDESNKITMQDMLELPLFQDDSNINQQPAQQSDARYDMTSADSKNQLKLDHSPEHWLEYRPSQPSYQNHIQTQHSQNQQQQSQQQQQQQQHSPSQQQSSAAHKTSNQKPMMKTITIHTMDNGVCQRQTKLVDEAYDDVGTVAEIQETGKLQPFEFILVSPTSPLQKVNDESLTYLNQGQAYGLKLKRRPDQMKKLNLNMDMSVRLTLRVIFHDRRLQNTEQEQILQWTKQRPAERFVEIDVPLSENVCNVMQSQKDLNCSEFSWTTSKDAVVFIKVNCISTEFTQKKHGGEKGAGFRLQLDTFKEDATLTTMGYASSLCLQASSCQIRVFKPRGADRKLKTDHIRVSKQCEGENRDKTKYSVCYDRTRLMDTIPWERRDNRIITPIPADIDVHTVQQNPVANNQQLMIRQSSQPDISSDFSIENMESSLPEYCGAGNITENSTIGFVQAWLRRRNFHNFQQKFANYSGPDILMLSREDMIQIGLEQPTIHIAECIRLYNAINSPSRSDTRSSLLLYIRQPDDDLHYPIFVKTHTVRAFIECLALVTHVEPHKIERVINRRKSASTQGDINVMVTDDMIATFKSESSFCIKLIKNDHTDGYTAIIHR